MKKIKKLVWNKRETSKDGETFYMCAVNLGMRTTLDFDFVTDRDSGKFYPMWDISATYDTRAEVQAAAQTAFEDIVNSLLYEDDE